MSFALDPPEVPVGKRILAWGTGVVALLLLVALVAFAVVTNRLPASAVPARPDASQCFGNKFDVAANDAAVARDLMSQRLAIDPHPATTLPADLTWREDPHNDANWQFNLHTLRWAEPLRREGARTGNEAMLQRHREIVRDWIGDNPRFQPPSAHSWSDMATGLRAVVLACAIKTYGREAWLIDALRMHGEVLRDPAFAPPRGNHALHVLNGLLVAGCLLDNPEWITDAEVRIELLLEQSVDEEGVTDEGSVSYQLSNYKWYLEARDRFLACDRTPPPAFGRVQRMPEFLAHMVVPDGKYEQIGDTDLGKTVPLPGTAQEYAVTRGSSGTAPTEVFKSYARGYVTGRSGWGTDRPFADETFYSLRFGPSLNDQIHAHEDAGALTLYSAGSRLLFDAGRYRYGSTPMTKFLKSRAAHNVVDVPGAKYLRDADTQLVVSRSTPEYDLVTVHSTALQGTTWQRTVFFSRTGNYLIVDDRVTNTSARPMIQRWNLGADRSFQRAPGVLATDGDGANLSMFWLGDAPALTITKGQREPLLGWRSMRYGTYYAAPSVGAAQFGRQGRFTTVIVPRRAGEPPLTAQVSNAQVTDDAVQVSVTVAGRTENVTFSKRDASISRP